MCCRRRSGCWRCLRSGRTANCRRVGCVVNRLRLRSAHQKIIVSLSGSARARERVAVASDRVSVGDKRQHFTVRRTCGAGATQSDSSSSRQQRRCSRDREQRANRARRGERANSPRGQAPGTCVNVKTRACEQKERTGDKCEVNSLCLVQDVRRNVERRDGPCSSLSLCTRPSRTIWGRTAAEHAPRCAVDPATPSYHPSAHAERPRIGHWPDVRMRLRLERLESERAGIVDMAERPGIADLIAVLPTSAAPGPRGRTLGAEKTVMQCPSCSIE